MKILVCLTKGKIFMNDNAIVSQTSGELARYTEKIKDRIKVIADNFFYVGYYLWEVKYFKYYLEGGYKDIYDFSEKELSFKKSSTKNFISLVEKYADYSQGSYPKMWMAEKYKSFGYSQLTEMLSLSPSDRDKITSDMTVKQIREKKKELNKVENDAIDTVIDVEYVHAPVESETIDTSQTILDVSIEADFSEISDLKDKIKQLEEQINVQALRINKYHKTNVKLLTEKEELINNTVINSDSKILSDILSTLTNEWSNAIEDEYARGLDRAIQLINKKLQK